MGGLLVYSEQVRMGYGGTPGKSAYSTRRSPLRVRLPGLTRLRLVHRQRNRIRKDARSVGIGRVTKWRRPMYESLFRVPTPCGSPTHRRRAIRDLCKSLDKRHHPSAYLSISLSDGLQIAYCIAQMRQVCDPKLNPVLVITITGFSDH